MLIINNSISFMWIFAIIAFILLEVATPQLVTIWFAIGAIFAMIANVFGADMKVQIGLFLMISLIAIVSLRPIYKKYLKTEQIKTNVNAIIGSKGIVTKEINNDEASGLVKINGQVWSARSESGDSISVNERVEVLRVEGVKIIVKLAEKKYE